MSVALRRVWSVTPPSCVFEAPTAGDTSTISNGARRGLRGVGVLRRIPAKAGRWSTRSLRTLAGSVARRERARAKGGDAR